MNFTDMCWMPDDEDLRHQFLESCRGNRCHLCLRPKNHTDHVKHSRLDEFRGLLETSIDAARLAS